MVRLNFLFLCVVTAIILSGCQKLTAEMHTTTSRIDPGQTTPTAVKQEATSEPPAPVLTTANSASSALDPKCSLLTPTLIGPPPGQLRLSPDGQYIAFSSFLAGVDDTISLIDMARFLENGDLSPVVSLPGSYPNWSPDGQQLVFARQVEGNWDIYKMTVNGQVTQLTRNRGKDTYPAWLPDGQHIIFYSEQLGNGLYIMKTDGSEQEWLGMYGDHTWSPDGRNIAFTVFGNSNSDIGLKTTADEQPALLTEHPGCDWSPLWSPDGQQVAFLSDRDQGINIYTVSLADGTTKRLTDLVGVNTQQTWSPDGTKLAFVHHQLPGAEGDPNEDFLGTQDLYIVDLISGQIEQLTQTDDEAEWSPQWSPSGEYIVYFSYSISEWRTTRNWLWQIKQVKVDSTNAVTLLRN
jgi:Tol biopolymer transport system component